MYPDVEKAMAIAEKMGFARASGRFSFAFGRLAHFIRESPEIDEFDKKYILEFVDWVLTNE
jgi:hypothetical protein